MASFCNFLDTHNAQYCATIHPREWNLLLTCCVDSIPGAEQLTFASTDAPPYTGTFKLCAYICAQAKLSFFCLFNVVSLMN
jgi:hypothetical protein